ncbi:MAG TPA: hypothetical protein VFQ45_22150 [Longimicrobium sp.]|nr:hypothetical protein [Longimicrobium sp.]
MKFGVLVLAAALAVPAPAAAQGSFTPEPPPELLPTARFALTPFVGLRVPYASGEYFVITGDGSQVAVNEDRGGGAAFGLNAEARIRGPLSAVASIAYTASDQDVLNVTSNDVTESFFGDGPAVTMFKVGLAYRLPDPIPDERRFHPAAFVYAAPAVVWMNYADIEGLDESVGHTARHFAINMGVDAVTRIGTRGLALQIGLEDYLTFWDQDVMRERDEVVFSDVLDDDTVVLEYDERSSNILLLRLGLSFRF